MDDLQTKKTVPDFCYRTKEQQLESCNCENKHR